MDFCMSMAAEVILEEMKKESGFKNVVLSPLSINMMINMVASGSAGKTLEEFLKFLGSKDVKDLNDKSSLMMSLVATSSSDSNSESSSSDSSARNDNTSNPKVVVNPPMLDCGGYDQYYGQNPSGSSYCSSDPPIFNYGRYRKGPSRTSYYGRYGAQPQGRSRPYDREMDLLHNKGVKKAKGKAPTFSLANSLWVDHHFSLIPSFQETTKTIYNAHVESADFINQADDLKNEVNSWVNKETRGLIQGILPPGYKLTPPLCLVNALYFKGSWEKTFDASKSRHDKFHLHNGETIDVPFMISRDKFYSYGSFEDFKVVKLRYQKGQDVEKLFSMYIFLPHKRNGLQDLMEKFNRDTTILQLEHFHHLPQEKISNLWIPKLKFMFDFDVREIMENKGLTTPFRMGADFTNMVDSSEDSVGVFISSILHKACIEVNEEGTEAAAVTFCNIVSGCSMYRPPPTNFVADHPFMFMIVEEISQAVVFTGVVLNPLL